MWTYMCRRSALASRTVRSSEWSIAKHVGAPSAASAGTQDSSRIHDTKATRSSPSVAFAASANASVQPRARTRREHTRRRTRRSSRVVERGLDTFARPRVCVHANGRAAGASSPPPRRRARRRWRRPGDARGTTTRTCDTRERARAGSTPRRASRRGRARSRAPRAARRTTSRATRRPRTPLARSSRRSRLGVRGTGRRSPARPCLRWRSKTRTRRRPPRTFGASRGRPTRRGCATPRTWRMKRAVGRVSRPPPSPSRPADCWRVGVETQQRAISKFFARNTSRGELQYFFGPFSSRRRDVPPHSP